MEKFRCSSVSMLRTAIPNAGRCPRLRLTQYRQRTEHDNQQCQADRRASPSAQGLTQQPFNKCRGSRRQNSRFRFALMASPSIPPLEIPPPRPQKGRQPLQNLRQGNGQYQSQNACHGPQIAPGPRTVHKHLKIDWKPWVTEAREARSQPGHSPKIPLKNNI